ncbi:MAG TPA: type ISP restriction/modification enzyme [Gemmataceae bacterium]
MSLRHSATPPRYAFDNPEFTRRNVIAAEVETVIDALVSKNFNRDDFQKSLDRFYVAIENAAHTMPEFSDKQHFLNTVYERFFQGYSVKVADTHGIVYTPQAIVDFMCASVAEVLQTEFGKGLGDAGVHILDPCTGTGNFIVNILRRIPKKDLPRMYAQQLFANEVMLLPYYIAAQNIEHTYSELTGRYEPFEGLCFVDTLDLAEEKPHLFSFAERNTERVERQKAMPITVIVGNPPYNVGQLNENDNNKNRKYEVIDGRVKATYAKDSAASSVSKLNDAYVKFFRWAVDRLGERNGIVCLVTNNGFVDQLAFDGMRYHIFRDFTDVYHLDLNGNVRKNPRLSGTAHNVFGIQVGVGITVAIRVPVAAYHRLFYYRVPEEWRKELKLRFLAKSTSIEGVQWQPIQPSHRNAWIIPQGEGLFQSYLPMGTKEAKKTTLDDVESVFRLFSLGVVTARDDTVYDFSTATLSERVREAVEDYNREVDRFQRTGKKAAADDFVLYDKVKWSRDLKKDLVRGNYAVYDDAKIRRASYRPFCKKYLFYDRVLNEETRFFALIAPPSAGSTANESICISGLGHDVFICIAAATIIDYKYSNATNGGSQCFPFYVYDEDGSNRRENVTDWALKQFRTHYGDKKITKWDIFHYVYGILHHPGYRTKFADNLKRELPRIPFAPDFRAFARAGEELARLHLDYERLDPYPLKFVETEDVPLSYRVEDKMRLSKDRTELVVNPSLTLAGIPPEVFDYRLGNRSALEWVIDQYRVTEDARSGIHSDPNRADDPEYIVRLVGQVVRVSLETVRIVNGLPEQFAPATGNA